MPRRYKNCGRNAGAKMKNVHSKLPKKKKRFILYENEKPTTKVYSIDFSKNKRKVALKAAKKAWCDNKNLEVIHLQNAETYEVYKFESKMWTHPTQNKFLNH